MEYLLTAFNQCFLFLRDPTSGAEDISAMKAAGFTAVFCNIGDFSPTEWDTIKTRADALSIICGVWARTVDSNNNFNPHIIDRLISVGDAWNCPIIVNSESELKGSEKILTQYISDKMDGRDFAVSMEARPFANVDWTPLASVPILPQMFIEAGDISFAATKQEWHDYGIKCIYFTFGVIGRQPSYYKRQAPYSCYTADDMGLAYSDWSPTSTGYDCRDAVEVFMEKIGNAHGITAFINWLRTQPGVPVVRSGNWDARNPATWPWPERFERTLKILAKDHDAQ